MSVHDSRKAYEQTDLTSGEKAVLAALAFCRNGKTKQCNEKCKSLAYERFHDPTPYLMSSIIVRLYSNERLLLKNRTTIPPPIELFAISARRSHQRQAATAFDRNGACSCGLIPPKQVRELL